MIYAHEHLKPVRKCDCKWLFVVESSEEIFLAKYKLFFHWVLCSQYPCTQNGLFLFRDNKWKIVVLLFLENVTEVWDWDVLSAF